MQRTRTTGIRATLIPTNCNKDDVLKWMNTQRKLTNYASKHLLRLMKESPSIAEIVFSNNSHYLAYEVHHNILLKHTDFRNYRIELGLRTSTNERLAAALAGRFYHGYGQRNGDMAEGKWEYKLPNLPAITRQNKAIHVKDSVLRKFVDGDEIITSTKQTKNEQVLIENVRFELQGLFGKIYEFKVLIPNNQVHLLKFLSNKSNVDCNIFFINGNLTIVFKVEEEYELAYEPVSTLGLDLNKRENVFAAMSDGEIIQLTSDLRDNILLVKSLDEKIHEVKESKLRRNYRIQWKKARKELSKKFEPIMKRIISKVEDNKYLLAIDGVTQAKNGSFGHAELKEELVRICKKKNLPFIIVPSAHTSSDCSYCFERSKEYNQVSRSKDFKHISCNVCEKTYHADINAARNIAHDGEYIFNNSTMDFPKDKFGRALRSKRPPTSVANRQKKLKFVDYNSNDLF